MGTILGEAKVEARLQPIGVSPAGIVHWVTGIAEPGRIRLRDEELRVGNDFDVGRHIAVAGVRGEGGGGG